MHARTRTHVHATYCTEKALLPQNKVVPLLAHTHTQTHTHTRTHARTPTTPPNSPDNIGVLEGFELPQYRHLPDGRQRHALFLGLDPNSLQSHEASSILQVPRLVHFPVSALSDLGHGLILRRRTVLVHFRGLLVHTLSLHSLHSVSSLSLRILRGIPARVTSHGVSHKGIFTGKRWHAQCLDDRETRMGGDTIFVTCAQSGPQVGTNATVIMFYSDYQQQRSRRVPTSTPPPPDYARRLVSSYRAHRPRQIIQIKTHSPSPGHARGVHLTVRCAHRREEKGKKKKNHLARTFCFGGAFTCAPFRPLKRNKRRKTQRQRSDRRHGLYARRRAEFAELLRTIFTFLTVCGDALSSSTWLATDCIVCGLPTATVPFGKAAKVAFLKTPRTHKKIK